MSDQMPRIMVSLTENDIEALERIRRKRGDRSRADTIRQLIRNADVVVPVADPVPRVATSAPVGRERPKPGALLKKR